jgi:hypothetical protein
MNWLIDEIMAGLTAVKVCAKAGELILWNSMTVHCAMHPKGDQPRMCVYVSMQPRSACLKSQLDKRIKLYEEGRMTNHWCYTSQFSANPKGPRVYSKSVDIRPNPIEIAELNTLQRRMVGYDE